MNKAKIDVPVALIFFNRPEQFARVFETVKQARPTRLFLIQDGPRPGNSKDAENIQKCRDVIDIDWECEVESDFSEENLGCGKRIFTGLSRCFQKVDRLVILEDDCVASQSFFPFCQEILERYKDDLRVSLISGMNHLNTFPAVEDDYLFSCVGSIAGWATWKRCWDGVTFSLEETVKDSQAMRLLQNYEKYASHRSSVYSTVKRKYAQMCRGEKLSSWSTQFGINQILNSQLVIVPRVNLMSNIGLSAESANSVSNIKLVPRGARPLYQLKLFEMEFPLKHPKYVINDIGYCKAVDKLMHPSKPVRIMRRIESVFLRIVGGDTASISKAIKRRFARLFR